MKYEELTKRQRVELEAKVDDIFRKIILWLHQGEVDRWKEPIRAYLGYSLHDLDPYEKHIIESSLNEN